MVTVAYSTRFEKTVRKIHDAAQKERVKAQIRKIVSDPRCGKPVRYCRKNTRGVTSRHSGCRIITMPMMTGSSSLPCTIKTNRDSQRIPESARLSRSGGQVRAPPPLVPRSGQASVFL